MEQTTLCIVIAALVVALVSLFGCAYLMVENANLKRDNRELRGEVRALLAVVERHYPNEFAQALQAAR